MPNLNKKVGKGGNPSRNRKKKFHDNQFTAECETEFVSTSAKKLNDVNYDKVIIDMTVNYVILHFLNVFSFISTFVKCANCGSDIKFFKTNGAGVAFKLVAQCSCSNRSCDSSPIIQRFSEINRRLMLAVRILGGGLQSLKMLCAILDITPSFSNNIYYTFLNNLHTASKALFEHFQKKAVKEEISENAVAGKEPLNLTVSGDSSWKKRGFSSLFGLATLIGKYTNKVLDVAVKSSFCQSYANWKNKQGTVEYDLWKESHEKVCSANHQGSAGKMEVDAMKEMFARSKELLGVQYEFYIGDGDTKTFKALNECLNSCVWKLAPKHLHCASKTIEIATFLGVCLFNEGHVTILKIMELLGIAVGLEAHNFVRIADDKRITAAEKSLSDGAKKAASAKKSQQATQIEQNEVEEGLLYGPGIAD